MSSRCFARPVFTTRPTPSHWRWQSSKITNRTGWRRKCSLQTRRRRAAPTWRPPSSSRPSGPLGETVFAPSSPFSIVFPSVSRLANCAVLYLLHCTRQVRHHPAAALIRQQDSALTRQQDSVLTQLAAAETDPETGRRCVDKVTAILSCFGLGSL